MRVEIWGERKLRLYYYLFIFIGQAAIFPEKQVGLGEL